MKGKKLELNNIIAATMKGEYEMINVTSKRGVQAREFSKLVFTDSKFFWYSCDKNKTKEHWYTESPTKQANNPIIIFVVLGCSVGCEIK